MGRGMSRWRRTGRAVLGACLFLAAIGSGAGTAAGSTWSDFRLPGEAAKVAMFDVSCPTASLCVAVGGNNTIASSTNPTGGAGSWQVVYAGEGADPMSSNFRQIRGISCPSEQLCVAVTFEGSIYTTKNPTGGAGAWSVTDLESSGPRTHLYGISCPTADFCAASAGGAKVVTSTNPTGGAAAWTKTQLAGPLELRGISCASAALCVAVGDDGDNIRPAPGDQGVLLNSTQPLGGTWQHARIPAQGSLFGVSCPSAALCVSGDGFGNLLVSTAPGATGSWRAIDGGGSVQITAVDCIDASRCVAVDNNGDVLTSANPAGGAADWTFTNLLPYPGADGGAANHLFGVSCPSTSLCAASGNEGRLLVSGNPFDASPREAPRGAAAKKRKRRPKRPRTEIAAGPAPAIEMAGRSLPVRFRFFARKRVQVRGFLCKLDRRPLRRCRSPKIYRVGLGRHVFRVRAIGWTGLRGPAEVARFRVCRPTPYPNCLRPPAAARTRWPLAIGQRRLDPR